MSKRAQIGSRRPLRGVAARLLGAVIVPLVFLASVAGWLAIEQRAGQEKARQIQDQVAELVTLVDLNTALFDERLILIASGAEPPGPEIRAELDEARATTDELVAAIPTEARAFAKTDMTRVRQMQDIGGVRSARLLASFDSLVTQVNEQIGEDLAKVRESALVLGDERLAAAITTLDQTVLASTAGTAVKVDLLAYYGTEAFEQSLTRSELARSSQDFNRADAWLTENATGSVSAAWSEQRGDVALLDDQITAALEGYRVDVNESAASATLDPLFDTDSRGLASLPPLAASETSREADRLFNEAMQSARFSALLGVAVMVISALVAFVFARSILKPTSRFTEHARAMGRGDLDVEPLPLTGPTEFVAASQAFNDLVTNLQLVHKKTMALAVSDLDDPVLEEPLAGQLGETVRQSIQVLSESIHQREKLQFRLSHEATHDSLIGIANRAAAISQLEVATARAKRRGSILALIFIDLDEFKRVNDTYGHAVGDELLREIGRRMAGATRENDLLARLGGDEFLVVAEEFEDVDEVMTLAQRMIGVLAEPIVIGELILDANACAGVAIGPGDEEPLALLQHADLAVYEAKNQGSGSIHMYDEVLQARLRARTDIEDGLSTALESDNGQFSLVYQPILESKGSTVKHVEALLRWNRPDTGFVPPDLFIPIAEGSSLILDIDRWVLNNAFRQLKSWDNHPILGNVSLAVNISGRHLLDRDFVSDVVEAASSSGADLNRVILEVTETVLVEDLGEAAIQLQSVRDLGARVAVDDFGTGFTSIAHLRRLPIDSIKIDKGFVQGLPEASDDLSLVRMVSELAGHLGVPTVAEGVETQLQREVVTAVGCQYLQGYLFSPPLAPDKLAAWVEAEAAALRQSAALPETLEPEGSASSV